MRPLTNEEKGALLIAIGEQMLKRNLMAGAALDGLSDKEISESLQRNGVDGQIVEEIFEDRLALEEAGRCLDTTMADLTGELL